MADQTDTTLQDEMERHWRYLASLDGDRVYMDEGLLRKMFLVDGNFPKEFRNLIHNTTIIPLKRPFHDFYGKSIDQHVKESLGDDRVFLVSITEEDGIPFLAHISIKDLEMYQNKPGALLKEAFALDENGLFYLARCKDAEYLAITGDSDLS